MRRQNTVACCLFTNRSSTNFPDTPMLTNVTNSLKGSATFDVSSRYRYCLTRSWTTDEENTHQVAFIMLNPSKANAEQDDPTIRACSQFAQRWGYTQLTVVNLFAYCTTHPAMLEQVEDPIGPENDQYVTGAVKLADKVILAWGNQGILLNRDQTVINLISSYRHKLYCLKRNRTGQPCHPLYIKRKTVPFVWST